MASGTILYRLAVELSDVDRGVYTALDLRVALHPSEDNERLVTRCLAYCLCLEDGLSFGRGLSDADDPALLVKDGGDRIVHWIDVGHPGAERIHRASKRADRVTIVCHKGPEGLRRERDKRKIHAAERVGVLLLEPDFVRELALRVERNAIWSLVRSDSELHLTVGQIAPSAGTTLSGSVVQIPLTDV